MIATRRLKLMLVAFAALCLAAFLPNARAMDLPPGFSMDTITDVSNILQTCNGDFGDIVSLYMVEAGPLIKKVEDELKNAKEIEKTLKEAAAASNSTATNTTDSTDADAIAQSKATSAIFGPRVVNHLGLGPIWAGRWSKFGPIHLGQSQI